MSAGNGIGVGKPSWRRQAALRLLVILAVLASVIAAMMSASIQERSSAQVGGAQSYGLEVQNVAHYQGCNWTGMCSVKFNRTESAYIKDGLLGLVGFYIGGPAAAALGPMAARLADNPDICVQLNWNRYVSAGSIKVAFFTTFRC